MTGGVAAAVVGVTFVTDICCLDRLFGELYSGSEPSSLHYLVVYPSKAESCKLFSWLFEASGFYIWVSICGGI